MKLTKQTNERNVMPSCCNALSSLTWKRELACDVRMRSKCRDVGITGRSACTAFVAGESNWMGRRGKWKHRNPGLLVTNKQTNKQRSLNSHLTGSMFGKVDEVRMILGFNPSTQL
jgi:hypothetical protein